MKTFLLALILIAGVLLAGYLDKPPSEADQVYAACMQSRSEINGASEDYCAKLQDDYGMVFGCEKDYHTKVSPKCWAVKR